MVTVQLFGGGARPMIAAAVQRDVDRISKGSHDVRVPPRRITCEVCPLLYVGAIGFEPMISWFRTTRIAQTFPHADESPRLRASSKSTQRESNPHLRPGETVR